MSRQSLARATSLGIERADLEQREGRILRQGNQNEEIDIFNYVTESSYDTVMWQRVQAKALFIEQMRRNEVLDTEIEDLAGGDIGAAAAETKAIATGDPRYLRQVELDDAVRRLTALERAHHQSVRNRDWQVRVLEKADPGQAGRHRRHRAGGQRPRGRGDAPHRLAVGADTFADRPEAQRRSPPPATRLHGRQGPLDPTPGSGCDASPKPAEREFVTRIRERGVSCNVGDTKGHEIAAACGQLAAEACLGVREIDVLCAQADFGSGSSMAVRSRLRPRWRRDMTVPTGTPVTSAIIL